VFEQPFMINKNGYNKKSKAFFEPQLAK